MEWLDDAVVLSARPHGETAVLAVLLTRERGRHGGLVHGGRSRRLAATLATGTLVRATWRGRLAEQLGTLTLEPQRCPSLLVLDHADRLATLVSACALSEAACPDHEPHPGLYHGLVALLDLLADDRQEGVWWGEAYVRWELGLLAELGFALDLARCAATGSTEDLVYVSPRSGRAVCATAGSPYHDRLLPLPDFLTGHHRPPPATSPAPETPEGPPAGDVGGPEAIGAGLALTGYFLEHHLLAALHRPLPPARARLAEMFERARSQKTVA